MGTNNWDRVHRVDRLVRWQRSAPRPLRDTPVIDREEYLRNKDREEAILARKARRTF